MTTVAQRLGLALPPAIVTERGSCSRTDPEAFYPEGKGASTADAKRVCNRCPVIAECLQWALDTDEVHGVWGGLSQRQRTKLRRERDAANPATVWACPADAAQVANALTCRHDEQAGVA